MKKIILKPSGKEVSVEDGQTVLSALEKAGYALPNNCRAGACGECKSKVLKGEIDQGFVLDMALPQTERDQGMGLMCMAKPISDTIEIEFGTEDALPKLFPPKERQLHMVIEKQQVTPSIVRLRLRSLSEPMRFWPGQYITIGDSRKGIPKRCYSIANIPNSEGEIVLFITKVKNGPTSQWIHNDISEGDMLRIDGPYGTFIGDPSADTPVLCLAAGSGLAPIQSLATAAMTRGGFKHPATVLFSAKTKEDLLELGHFKFLDSRYRNFKFRYTLTQEESDDLRGRIPELLPTLYPNLSSTSIYIAGPTDFVSDCKETALKLGANDELIHTEGFTSQSAPQPQL